MPCKLELRPAQLVKGLLVKARPFASLDDVLVRHLGVVVILAQEEHFTAAKLHFVEQCRVRVLRHQLVEDV